MNVPDHTAGRWLGWTLAGVVLLLAGLFRLTTAFIEAPSSGRASLFGTASDYPEKSAERDLLARSFSATKSVAFATGCNPELLVYNGKTPTEKAQETIAAESMPSGSTEVFIPNEAAASLRQRQILGARVNSEANRILRRVARKYRLTSDQQAQVFPAIANAVPASAGLAKNMNGSVQETQFAALGIAPEIADWSVADSANEDSDVFAAASPTDPDALTTDSAPTSTAGTATPAKAKVSFADDDGFETALQASLEAIEEQLAPFLNNEQLATMNAEQIDRYYWWGEILIRLDGDLELEAAILAAALQPTASASSGTVATSESETAGSSAEANPAAHLGGNLFDLLGHQP